MGISKRVAVIGAVVAGVMVWLAAPASAELPGGTYTQTTIEGAGVIREGFVSDATITPCGPACVHVQTVRADYDLHLEGNVWTGGTYQLPFGYTCSVTLDNSTLVETSICPPYEPIRLQLAKVG